MREARITRVRKLRGDARGDVPVVRIGDGERPLVNRKRSNCFKGTIQIQRPRPLLHEPAAAVKAIDVRVRIAVDGRFDVDRRLVLRADDPKFRPAGEPLFVEILFGLFDFDVRKFAVIGDELRNQLVAIAVGRTAD